MLACHPGRALARAGDELRVAGREDAGECIGERFGASGRDEPARDAGLDELRDARHPGAQHRPAQGERLHDDDGQALGEARQHERACGPDLLLHRLLRQRAEEPHAFAESAAPDALGELPA